MAWTGSRAFVPCFAEILKRSAGATAFDLDGDTFNVALFNNNVNPLHTVALATSAYNTGTWLTANEQSASGWAAGGVVLTTPVVTTVGGSYVIWDATDTSSAAGTTLSNVCGCLVYDNTLAGKYGVCYNDFGGTNAVSNGVLTLMWDATYGITRLTF